MAVLLENTLDRVNILERRVDLLMRNGSLLLGVAPSVIPPGLLPSLVPQIETHPPLPIVADQANQKPINAKGFSDICLNLTIIINF